ncbi:MAG: insulinase family protein [Acidobacteria bacterium]|nr:insulinase family protein [Acidobacteriota bacterium]
MTSLRHSSIAAIIIVTGVLLGASGLVAQAPDRSKPPTPGPPPSLTIPATEKRALPNGLPVWIVEQHEVPVVQIDLLIKPGGSADPPGKFGLASMMADMLDEGAGSRSALEIADAVDSLGASLSSGSGLDLTTVRLHVPVARLADALPIMADVALRPTFPDKELDRLRSERLTSLLQSRDDPASIASVAFPQIVFGKTHRYGVSTGGTSETLRGITVADLRQAHERTFHPKSATIVVVGDITADAILPQLESAFGGWKGAAAAAPTPVAAAPQLTRREVVLIDKPGAAQSQIVVGWVGVPRTTPDYFPLLVMNTVLGGSFTSRLNQNLRETHGYAYGASSTFDMRRSAGPFYASARVQTDKTGEALKEFFIELNRIHEPVPADELTRAKNYLALSFPRRWETTTDIAFQLQTMFTYDLPENYFATYLERLQRVDAAEARRTAQTYIQPEKFAVLVVGDLKRIDQSVRALDLGPLRTLDIDEVLPK